MHTRGCSRNLGGTEIASSCVEGGRGGVMVSVGEEKARNKTVGSVWRHEGNEERGSDGEGVTSAKQGH
jgi:hypothetical protein